MIVPELPAEIAELKRRVGRFIEDEVYPVEQRIVERNAIDAGEVEALRAKARAAGFSMLNMPAELGGRDLSMLAQVALEEESGKATNGLGFTVVDRGPRELLELLTPAQVERYVMPIVRGEFREAWALTEPGAGSDLAALAATADRDGDDWVLNGEKWFVTSEGDAGFYIVAAVHEGEQMLFLVEPGTPGMEITRTPRFLHDPYLDHHPEIVFTDCRVPDANRVPGRGRRLPRVDPRRAPVHRGALLRRGRATARRSDGLGAGARGVRRADHREPGRVVPAGRLADGAPRRTASDLPRRPRVRHAAPTGRSSTARSRWRSCTPRRWRAGSPTAAVQILGGRGYMHENAAARFYRELRVDRIWEGTSEIQRLIIARGLQKRGAAPYLGWEVVRPDTSSHCQSARVRPRRSAVPAARVDSGRRIARTTPRLAQAVRVSTNGGSGSRRGSVPGEVGGRTSWYAATNPPAGPTPSVYGCHHSSKVGCSTGDGQHRGLDITQPGALEEPCQTPLLRTCAARFVLDAGVDLPGCRPERAQRATAATEIPRHMPPRLLRSG